MLCTAAVNPKRCLVATTADRTMLLGYHTRGVVLRQRTVVAFVRIKLTFSHREVSALLTFSFKKVLGRNYFARKTNNISMERFLTWSKLLE